MRARATARGRCSRSSRRTAVDRSATKSTQTWAVAETLDVKFDNEPDARNENEVLTRAFERCLSAISLLSESSRLTTGEIWSSPLARDSLDPEIKYALLAPGSRATLTENYFRVNHRKINPVALPHNEQEVSALIRHAVARRLESDAAASPHPFITARSLALEAENQRLHGASSASIVSLQASLESLLRGLCTMLHRDLGTPVGVITEKGGIPFESLLKRELPGLLGGAMEWLSVNRRRIRDQALQAAQQDCACRLCPIIS